MSNIPVRVTTSVVVKSVVDVYTAIISIYAPTESEPEFKWNIDRVYDHVTGGIEDVSKSHQTGHKVRKLIGMYTEFDPEAAYYRALAAMVERGGRNPIATNFICNG